MSLDNWDDLKFVLAMHRHGTMSAAARYLDTNVATVSRRIDRLSQDLGVPLFQKHGQTLTPTPAAVRLANAAEGIDQMLRAELGAVLAPGDTAEMQTLDLSAPPSVHAAFVIPKLAELKEALPQVNLVLTEKVFAQGLGEADIQIRIGRPEGGRLRARKYRDFALRVFHGKDHKLDGEWLGLSQRYPDADILRTIYDGALPEPRYRLEELTTAHQVACQTGLPCVLPDFAVSPSDGLVPADLPDNLLPAELWITYHETRHADANLRGLVSWLCDPVPANRQNPARATG